MDTKTPQLTIEKPFALFHQETDRSGDPKFIYIGTDKAKAFDQLMKYEGYFDSGTLHIEYASEYKEDEK